MLSEKRKAYIKAWKKAHPSCGAEAKRLWWKRNKKKASMYRKQWRIKNPERALEADRKRRMMYADKIRVRNRDYTRAHPEQNRERSKKWRKENPEKSMNNRVRYRAKILANGGRLSRGLTKRLLATQEGRCANPKCRKDLSITGIHRDHIMPIAAGGAHSDSNIQLLCPRCNLSKGRKTFVP